MSKTCQNAPKTSNAQHLHTKNMQAMHMPCKMLCYIFCYIDAIQVLRHKNRPGRCVLAYVYSLYMSCVLWFLVYKIYPGIFEAYRKGICPVIFERHRKGIFLYIPGDFLKLS